MFNENLKISLKAARVNAGFTQEEAAKKLGIATSTLINWEKRPDNIPAYRQRNISEAYQIPIGNLIFLPIE